MISPIELFAQSRMNLEALQSFSKLFEFKKIVEKEFRRKISFDQLGEIILVISRNPEQDEMVAEVTRILGEVA